MKTDSPRKPREDARRRLMDDPDAQLWHDSGTLSTMDNYWRMLACFLRSPDRLRAKP